MSSDYAVVVALDVGQVRIGVAEGSTAAKIAHPYKTLASSNFAAEFASITQDLKPAVVVVGLPRNMQGIETDQTRYVQQFVKDYLQDKKVVFQDEALTSVKAEEELQKTRPSLPKRRHRCARRSLYFARLF